MNKKHKRITVAAMFCSVVTDAQYECKSAFIRNWTLNRKIAKDYGVKDGIYKQSVKLVREMIRRWRVQKYISAHLEDYLTHKAYSDMVSIEY